MLLAMDRKVKDELVQDLQAYMQSEMDLEPGAFETEFLLDHLIEIVGPRIYNQALRDIQVHLSGYLDTLNERIDELAKPLPRDG